MAYSQGTDKGGNQRDRQTDRQTDGGAKYERGMKKRHFQPINRRISETVQDRTEVTIND